MAQPEVVDRVKQVMSALLAVRPSEIGDQTSIETVERWDSLQHVNLMMALEQEFGIHVDVVDAGEMTSFPAICRTLARYVGDTP